MPLPRELTPDEPNEQLLDDLRAAIGGLHALHSRLVRHDDHVECAAAAGCVWAAAALLERQLWASKPADAPSR